MQTIIALVTVIVITYTLVMFWRGRAVPTPFEPPDSDVRFVFMVPCMNEELVLRRTIDRLLALRTSHQCAILVIDDGSSDGTSNVAREYDSSKVWLLRRDHPNAQQGKGEALNAAYRHLRKLVQDSGVSPDSVIVAVMDADGRLDPDALTHVAPLFNDPECASVQIKVRIHNAADSIVARLQDIEFTSYSEVFQRGRSNLGSAGLGGNGQFARLSALESLGDAPWSDCLTEDLELGIEFLLKGWTNRYSHKTFVSQQGLTDFGPLVRQRTRWFQGHLQCVRLVGRILKSRMGRWSKFDLAFHLVNPILMLALQTLSLVWMVKLAVTVATQPLEVSALAFSGLRPVLLYVFAFGLAPLVAYMYLRSEPELGLAKGIFAAHLYILYSYMWYFAGIRAAFRHLVGRKGWVKTARSVGTGDEARPQRGWRLVPSVSEIIDLRTFDAPLPALDLCTLDGDFIGRLDPVHQSELHREFHHIVARSFPAPELSSGNYVTSGSTGTSKGSAG